MAASEGVDVLIVETNAPGGQAGSSSKIENYLGFPTGISGQALAARAYNQAAKFGAQLLVAQGARELACSRRARAIIIATGAAYRKLDVADQCLQDLSARPRAVPQLDAVHALSTRRSKWPGRQGTRTRCLADLVDLSRRVRLGPPRAERQTRWSNRRRDPTARQVDNRWLEPKRPSVAPGDGTSSRPTHHRWNVGGVEAAL